jgi:hypothetical protein
LPKIKEGNLEIIDTNSSKRSLSSERSNVFSEIDNPVHQSKHQKKFLRKGDGKKLKEVTVKKNLAHSTKHLDHYHSKPHSMTKAQRAA